LGIRRVNGVVVDIDIQIHIASTCTLNFLKNGEDEYVVGYK
jgi:hypothetical protein